MPDTLDDALNRIATLSPADQQAVAAWALAHLRADAAFAVEDIFSIQGRGRVFIGTVKSGRLEIGTLLFHGSAESQVAAQVLAMESFQKALETAEVGENVGIIFHGPTDTLDHGSVLRGFASAS